MESSSNIKVATNLKKEAKKFKDKKEDNIVFEQKVHRQCDLLLKENQIHKLYVYKSDHKLLPIIM